MSKAKKPVDIEEQLRTAIAECGMNAFTLSKAAGVAPATLTRFIKGERDLMLGSVAKLCAALGLELTSITTPKAPKAAKRVLAVDLLAIMRRIEPGADRGALVGARDLRNAAGLTKVKFDAEALRLARAGVLSLHQHDYPTSLDEAGRDELVSDGKGTFFVGMAIRRAE